MTTLKGGPELLAALDKLGDKLARNVLRGGTRAGAIVIAKDAQRRVRRKSGKVAKSIGVSTRAPSNGLIVATIRTKGEHSFVAVFLEGGTVPHMIAIRAAKLLNDSGKQVSVRTQNRAGAAKGATPMVQPHLIGAGLPQSLVIDGRFVGKSVMHPGIKPEPFMLPALEAQADAAVKALGDYVRSRLTAEGLDAPYIEIEEDREAA